MAFARFSAVNPNLSALSIHVPLNHLQRKQHIVSWIWDPGQHASRFVRDQTAFHTGECCLILQ
jgi:hypothetical protein